MNITRAEIYRPDALPATQWLNQQVKALNGCTQ